jgi:GDPmannose 4,6-dehydratase
MQWMMLQQDEPKDYVIATGIQYSVKEFIENALRTLGVMIRWEGEGKEEIGVVDSFSTNYESVKVGHTIVRIDSRYFRPSEVETLLGDPAKAKADLGWIQQISLDEMIDEMVAHDLNRAKRHALLKSNGYDIPICKEG